MFAKKNSKTTEKKEKIRPTARAVFAEIFPAGIGLNLVLSIFESITLSFHIFSIAEPDAPIAINNKEKKSVKSSIENKIFTVFPRSFKRGKKYYRL